jgi:hypothetical protein
MLDDRNIQIPPPKSWSDFEYLCLNLFQAVWKDPLAQKNGQSGQSQNGVDVFGWHCQLNALKYTIWYEYL